MRPLQITLFIIALVFLSTQTFRHIYVKFIVSNESILDVYDEKISKEVKQSNDIDELIIIFEKARNDVQKYESNTENKEIEISERYETEPYKTEYIAKQAIKEWEEYNNIIKKMWFYWTCGLLSVLAGFIAYTKVDKWAGMVGFITGFSEMIYWTSPAIIGLFGPRFEFERLLTNKLIFSIISWIILVISWFVMDRIINKNNKSNV